MESRRMSRTRRAIIGGTAALAGAGIVGGVVASNSGDNSPANPSVETSTSEKPVTSTLATSPESSSTSVDTTPGYVEVTPDTGPYMITAPGLTSPEQASAQQSNPQNETPKP